MATDTCPWCEEPILDGDPVIVVNDGTLPFHKECMLRQVFGSVGHQRKRCYCYGGMEEDPPGLTPRQAARAAVRLFNRRPAPAPIFVESLVPGFFCVIMI